MKLSATAVSEALACGLAVSLCTRTGVQVGVAYLDTLGGVVMNGGNLRQPPAPDLRAVTVDGGARFEAITPNGQAFLDLVLEACGLA